MWARQLEEAPERYAVPAPRQGAKGRGLRFEDKIGAALRRRLPPAVVQSGQWFEYEHAHGKRLVAQLDHYLLLPHTTVLLECKLTERAEAWGKIERVYVPILRRCYLLPVVKVQVCGSLDVMRRGVGAEGWPRVLYSLDEVIRAPDGERLVWLASADA